VIHELKTLSGYFEEVWEGRKPFEIRNNDRDFKVDDCLILKEIDPCEGGAIYTGRKIIVPVSYLTDFEQKPGYVVLGLAMKSAAYLKY